MTILSRLIRGLAKSLAISVLLLPLGMSAANWPGWRGADGLGICAERNLPDKWSATENVRWKVALPEPGNSTPIVWGERVFVAQAVGKRRTIMCFDRANGALLWQHGPENPEAESTHETNPYCASSPVTDGERVIAWFGSAGVYCCDFTGKELWHRDLGKQEHDWGYGSSPLIHDDLCFLYFGPGKRAFLVALNKQTGKTVWQVNDPPVQDRPRNDGFRGQKNGYVGTFSSPILVKNNNRVELVMSYPQLLCAYEPVTGKELWRCDGLNELVYASPLAGSGVVVGMGGFLGTAIAVKNGGKGDVTATHRLWREERTKNRLGSGVIKDDHVYILNTEGIAECIELRSGKTIWEERVQAKGPKSSSWSSMVLVGDRIYVLNQSGDTVMLGASPKYEALGVNSIGNELTNTSHAISDGEIFLRTHKHLWCIGEKRTAQANTLP
jgi:outer membrane protein assembly factor BamB